MISLIIDELINQFNSQLGADSSVDNKLGLITGNSLKGTSPNRTLAIIEGPAIPREFELGVLQPTTWVYGPIELQLICRGVEKEAKQTRRTLVSLIRQTLYNSTTRTALLSITNTVGTETERILRYNITRINMDSAILKGNFISIAVFQLEMTSEISISS